jgi:hypothetical protein
MADCLRMGAAVINSEHGGHNANDLIGHANADGADSSRSLSFAGCRGACWAWADAGAPGTSAGLPMVGNAVAPMPMSPAVEPIAPVPAPAAALGDQLDRRRSVNRGLALGRLAIPARNTFRGTIAAPASAYPRHADLNAVRQRG